MFNSNQLRKAIILPSLSKIGLYSLNGEELLVATAANESTGGTFLVQVDKRGGLFYGGGLGIYQMEKITHDSIWDAKLQRDGKLTALGQNILDACGFSKIPTATEMVSNLAYATMLARAFYTRFAEPLPPANDINAIWQEYKKRWNTEKGAATYDLFVANYKKFCQIVD